MPPTLPGLVERAAIRPRRHRRHPRQERGPAEASVEREQLVVTHRPGDRRGADLVAVDVDDWEDGTAVPRVEEAVAVPGRGRWPGLGLAVPDDHPRAGPGCPSPARTRSPAHSRARRPRGSCPVSRRQVAREPARPRERTDEPLDAGRVACHVPVRTHRATRRGNGWRGSPRAVARTRHQQDSSPAFVHEQVEVGVDEVDRGRRAPVPEQPRLDVVGAERLAQQRIRLR